MHPVIKITRRFLDGEITLYETMIGCADESSAVAAFPRELGDKVEFSHWNWPRYPHGRNRLDEIDVFASSRHDFNF